MDERTKKLIAVGASVGANCHPCLEYHVGRALETFRGESQLSTWIYRIATNAALDRFRQPAVRHRGERLLPVESIAEIKADQDIRTGELKASTEQKLIRSEMNGCIREIIQSLPEQYRSVIVLSELEDLKDSEIAEILGVTLQAAKVRLHRARARLRKELAAACVFYRDERNELACDRKNPSDE
ncbi:MAG: sigma-70 family RNA polymerase sigma factor [Syntrophales bacterium]